MKRCICGQLIDDTKEECSECTRPSSCTVDSIVGPMLPCPFCGGRVEAWDYDYRVTHKAGCIIAHKEWVVGEREHRAWNRRANMILTNSGANDLSEGSNEENR